jgi:tetratricopeptide (TPR) repeat protein
VSASAAASQLETLKAAADRALGRGDARAARGLFDEAAPLAPERVDLWMGLAASCRALRDIEGALNAIEGALAADPRCFPALLMKGSLLEASGQERQAAMIYTNALLIAPPRESLAEPARRAMDRAEAVRRRHVDALASALLAEIGLDAGRPASVSGRRAHTFAEATQDLSAGAGAVPLPRPPGHRVLGA